MRFDSKKVELIPAVLILVSNLIETFLSYGKCRYTKHLLKPKRSDRLNCRMFMVTIVLTMGFG